MTSSLFTLALLLSVALSSATPLHPHLHPAVRQSGLCDSRDVCESTEICVNNNGECDGSDCNGVCIPEGFFTGACSCEEPCDEGSCLQFQNEKFPIMLCFPDTLASILPDELLDNINSAFKPVDCPDATDGDQSDTDGDGSDGNGDTSESDGDQSGNAEGSPEPNSDDAVCIAAEMLSNHPKESLIFRTHVLARVLCDSAGSCATRGHIVNYKGNAMMMGTYCELVGCEQKVMHVNSPKYARGLKVPSRSQDLHFTAFAARYATRAEEAVLAVAVRAGL